jgi:hypothetical protein
MPRYSAPACEACSSSRRWMRELDSDDTGARFVEYFCLCGSQPIDSQLPELDRYFDQMLQELEHA